ncbi:MULTISPECIES: FeoB-associated Cys-rich membrane protein [Spirosoma]|uniref:FeoB-associated Cys-rich membrane protein n=2 Tax=Spirosoma TaxID=107 RepID=A0A6G9AR41_9BACT|nr:MULTISPECIES: FeoB-associated Cys-rich membrane protein [Spirosoma]QHV96734.1 FeoB-associated Cys-rich membrane protein [Spirosoma endbachense]QIP14806.1 FeoB-associated Cys-rich membrane protein [Spirosoma aureum]
MQEFIIFLIFAFAVGYMGNRAYRSFFKKQAGCGKGCGCETDAKTSAITTAK